MHSQCRWVRPSLFLLFNNETLCNAERMVVYLEGGRYMYAMLRRAGCRR